MSTTANVATPPAEKFTGLTSQEAKERLRKFGPNDRSDSDLPVAGRNRKALPDAENASGVAGHGRREQELQRQEMRAVIFGDVNRMALASKPSGLDS